jgi:Raffinose synthase or seed imbibition protein Sip1
MHEYGTASLFDCTTADPAVWWLTAAPCAALQLLRRLVLPDGSILRAQLPGRPTRDSLFRDPLRDAKSLLKVCLLTAHCCTWGLLLAFAATASSRFHPGQHNSLCRAVER